MDWQIRSRWLVIGDYCVAIDKIKFFQKTLNGVEIRFGDYELELPCDFEELRKAIEGKVGFSN